MKFYTRVGGTPRPNYRRLDIILFHNNVVENPKKKTVIRKKVLRKLNSTRDYITLYGYDLVEFR